MFRGTAKFPHNLHDIKKTRPYVFVRHVSTIILRTITRNSKKINLVIFYSFLKQKILEASCASYFKSKYTINY